MSIALAAAYGGILFFGLVDGLFVYPVTQVIIAVLIGLGIGITRASNTNPVTNVDAKLEIVNAQKKQPNWPYQLHIFCVIVLIFFATITILKIVPSQIPDTQVNEDHYFELHPGYQLTPRFWRQGWFTYDTASTHAPKPLPSSNPIKQ
jgi:quinol-cytochrome oxidoreductase complex cytochrome b subunit